MGGREATQQFTFGVVREGVIAEKCSANFGEISANFPQDLRALSWRNKTYFLFSANFLQNFRKLSAKTPSLTTP